MTSRRKRVVVGMSGGVDSAVAAAVLLKAGFDVHGAFLCMGSVPADRFASRSCCTPQDATDARRSAEQLGIPLHVRNIEGRMRAIVDRFVQEYQRGRTPNPCPLCNADVKMTCLIGLADALGAESIATGHYADIRRAMGDAALHRARCGCKDQSYVLFALPQAVLQRLLLPLGQVTDKQSVREMGHRFGLDVSDKPDSQDICFVPAGGHADLLARSSACGLSPGPIYDTSGRRIGTHGSHARYTIGQRRGLGVAAGQPLYVVCISPDDNSLVLGPRHLLRTLALEVSDAVWQQPVPRDFLGLVQVRYHGQVVQAQVSLRQDRRSFRVAFDEPADCAVPGQAAVVYDGDRLLGGGWVASVERIDSAQASLVSTIPVNNCLDQEAKA